MSEVKVQPRNFQQQSFWLRSRLYLLRMLLFLMQRIQHLDLSTLWSQQLTQLLATTPSGQKLFLSAEYLLPCREYLYTHILFINCVRKLCLSFPFHELMASGITMLFSDMYIKEFLVVRKAVICYSHVRNYEIKLK